MYISPTKPLNLATGLLSGRIQVAANQGWIQPVRLGGGEFSNVWYSSLVTASLYCKRDAGYLTTLLWKNDRKQNGFIYLMLFSDLYKIWLTKLFSWVWQ